MARGDGNTTRQMMSAPDGAHFIWVNEDLHYPKRLAEKIGRSDLKIVSPGFFINRWHGLTFTGIVLDHACVLSDEQNHGLARASLRIRNNELTYQNQRPDKGEVTG